MILGTIKGNVVSTRKCSSLVGFKLLLVEPFYGEKRNIIVAADTTQYALDRSAPVDAFVVGIVDSPPQAEL